MALNMQSERAERYTKTIGKKLFSRIRKQEPSRFHPERYQDFLMRLMMKDENLRYRMLRFVDVFPSLRTPNSRAAHLDEYLSSSELEIGLPSTRLSDIARVVGKERTATHLQISAASNFAISRMGSQFIAGHRPREVAGRIRQMEKDGFQFSLDLLGEFVISESQADQFQKRYLEMIEGFDQALGDDTDPESRQTTGPRVNISIKLSSLTSKFEPMDPEGTSEAVRQRLRPMVRAAMKHHVFLNIDMEKFEYRDLTLRIILDLLDEEEFTDFDHLGTVHQAYLLDAEEKLNWLLDELEKRDRQMTVRLVKGAYWDSEQIWARQKNWPVPVYTDKRETDACYERCAEILIKNHRRVRVAIASHNVRSIAWAIAMGKRYKIPTERMEFQMLYGMAGPIKDALLGLGFPVRIYTPCGELIPGMSYLVRRILENTSNESFLRQRFADGVSEEALLADPKI